MSSNTTERYDPYAPLRHRDYRLLLAGRFITAFANEMLSFAIGWELWLRTHSAFALGMVGLVQVVPVILLSLPAGHRSNPRRRAGRPQGRARVHRLNSDVLPKPVWQTPSLCCERSHSAASKV